MLKSILIFSGIFLLYAPGAQTQAVPTFVGVRTFLGSPYVTNLDDLHADFAVLGVPFDEGTWGWPGERYGRRAKAHTTIITAEQIHRKGVEWTLSQIPAAENIYTTFDVDVMDPTLAPGTGTLEPDGLNFSEIDGLLKGAATKGRLVGVDIVEVNPMRDSSTRTEQTAIRLLIDTLGSAFK